MELIDKSAVKAEIERRKQHLLDNIICERDKEWAVRTAHQLNRIISFLDTLEVKEAGTVWHSFDEVLPPQGSDICVYWDRDKIITTGIWEESEKPKYASKWAYTSDLLNK